MEKTECLECISKAMIYGPDAVLLSLVGKIRWVKRTSSAASNPPSLVPRSSPHMATPLSRLSRARA